MLNFIKYKEERKNVFGNKHFYPENVKKEVLDKFPEFVTKEKNINYKLIFDNVLENYESFQIVINDALNSPRMLRYWSGENFESEHNLSPFYFDYLVSKYVENLCIEIADVEKDGYLQPLYCLSVVFLFSPLLLTKNECIPIKFFESPREHIKNQDYFYRIGLIKKSILNEASFRHFANCRIKELGT